jgi:hypothetical protein
MYAASENIPSSLVAAVEVDRYTSEPASATPVRAFAGNQDVTRSVSRSRMGAQALSLGVSAVARASRRSSNGYKERGYSRLPSTALGTGFRWHDDNDTSVIPGGRRETRNPGDISRSRYFFCLDSSFRWNDEHATLVIPDKNGGRRYCYGSPRKTNLHLRRQAIKRTGVGPQDSLHRGGR